MKAGSILTLLALGAVFLLFQGSTMSLQQPTARQILERMEAQTRGTSMYAEMKMTTVRPRFTREVTMKTWSKGDDFSMILITSPARDRGTSYLKRGKEIWNYVPNIDRLIKLPPSMMSQSWMGSDLSNDDLVRESSTINDFTYRIVNTTQYAGHTCWVLDLTPREGSSIVFGRVRMWITQSHYLQLKVENYDERGTLASTIQLSNIRQMGGRSIATEIEMIPADKPGHKTVLQYLDARFNLPIEDSFFTVQNMRNLR
jgi:outer membrane lipoprotein-sorting protein